MILTDHLFISTFTFSASFFPIRIYADSEVRIRLKITTDMTSRNRISFFAYAAGERIFPNTAQSCVLFSSNTNPRPKREKPLLHLTFKPNEKVSIFHYFPRPCTLRIFVVTFFFVFPDYFLFPLSRNWVPSSPSSQHLRREKFCVNHPHFGRRRRTPNWDLLSLSLLLFHLFLPCQ